MNPIRPTLRKELEKKRANLPARPIYVPPAAPAKPAAEMSFKRWAFTLIILALLGWCAGWGVSVLSAPKDLNITSLDDLPTKPRPRSINWLKSKEDADANGAPKPGDDVPDLANNAFATGPFRPGELIFSAGSPEELAALLQRAQAAGGTVLGTIRQGNSARLSFPNSQSMARFLRGNPGDPPVPEPDLNYTVTLPPDPTTPTDPYAPGSLRPFGATALDFMGVPQDNATWGRGVPVAMLDTGLSPGAPNILKGGTITQYDMTGGQDAPPVGHGDMVASLLAGANGEQGIVPASPLVSVRVLDANNQGDVFGVTDGIYTAVAQGAKVLSLSLGTSSSSQLLQSAIDYAIAQGVVVVASAGNDGNGQISYPAAYPGVIAVGAIDATGTRATFSNYGPQLDLMAPGVGLNTVTTNGNTSFSGTSAAAPLVAGAIAGLMSTNPGMTSQQAADLLSSYADFAGPVTDTGSNSLYGVGVVDVGRIINRNVAGLTDVAIADMYLNVTSLPTTPTAPMEVSIQNRGNTILGFVQVTLGYGSQVQTQTITGLKPNQVQALTINLPVSQLTQGGVQVDAQAMAPNDANTGNNVKSRIVRLVPATPPAGG